MELRIRNIFRPVAHFFALICQKLNFSSRAITAFFYFLILITAVLFLWLSASPYSGSILLLSIAFIFITGFFDEVKREFLILTRDAGGELILDRYADLLIIASIIYYLNLGSYRSIYATQSQHLFLGAVLGLGVLFLNYYLRFMVKGERSPGFEVPAERLFLLSAFAVAGYTHESFEDFLLAGLLALALLIYGSMVYGLMQRRRDLFSAASVAKVLSPVARAYTRALQLLKTGLGILYKATKKGPTRGEVFVEAGKPEEAQEYAFVPEPGQGYNFTVVLVDSATEEPISNASVELMNLEADKTISRYTDEAGKCVFTEVVEGQYVLSIKAQGFKEEQYERYISIDSGEVFRLSKPSLDLSVVVNDFENRSPISNAVVRLSLGKGRKIERLTDNLGVAYFDQLDFGFAELSVEAKGYVGREERLNLDAENVVSISLKRKAFLKFEGPSLVEYDRQEELEGAIKLVISEFIGREREVYMVSTGSILEACKGEQVRVVDFSSTMPEDLESMLEEIPAGGALLFEAITELIHRVGLDEALSFMEKTVNYLTKEGLNIVAFINRGAHGEKITAMFEKFFLSIAEVRDGGLVERSEI
jgi:hypothetical protein